MSYPKIADLIPYVRKYLELVNVEFLIHTSEHGDIASNRTRAELCPDEKKLLSQVLTTFYPGETSAEDLKVDCTNHAFRLPREPDNSLPPLLGVLRYLMTKYAPESE